MKKYQIIEILWLDSLHTSGWLKEKQVQVTSKERMTHRTVGYFLREDDKSILVIQSWNETDENEERDVDAIMEIPKGAILKIRKMK